MGTSIVSQELKMLEDFQQQFENGGYGTVNAWDELYYSGLIRAQTVNLDSRVCLATWW